MKATKIIVSLVCAVVMIVSAGQAAAADKAMAEQATDQAAIESVVAGKIDLNSADSEMLAQLPGIGLKKAELITAYREANGPFRSVEELLQVKGIGPKILEKLKPLVTIS
jgi:competence protein ComEA